MQAAALKLAYMEYADLGLDERLALLQGLLEQALDCEEVRELITSKVEAMALPRQKKPVSHCHSTLMSVQKLSNWSHLSLSACMLLYTYCKRTCKS